MTHAWARAAGTLRRSARAVPRPVWLRIAGAVAMLLALLAWAIASPVGASPDEDYHLASIWCAHGLHADVCAPGEDSTARAVPAAVAQANCYFHDAQASAACQADRPHGDGMISTKHDNFTQHLYPPVFYWVLGLFVGDSVDGSVVGMRVFNTVLYLGLVVAVYCLLPAGLRRPLVAGALLTAVPLGLFLIPSVNPSSWALLSATTVLASVVGYLRAETRGRRIGLGALAALATLLGAGARADAGLYALVAIAVAGVLTVRPTRSYVVRATYPALLAVLTIPLILTASQTNALDTGPAAAPLTLDRLLNTVTDIPQLWIGGLGFWGLGWLDTPMPGSVWVSAWSALVGVAFLALPGLGRRGGLATGLAALAVLLVPTYVQLASGLPVGNVVQPRYILPLVVVLMVSLLTRLEGAAFRLTSVHRWVVVILLAVANAVALNINIGRYVTGSIHFHANLGYDVRWWWPIGLGPEAVWVLGSLFFGLGVLLLTRELTTDAPASARLSSAPADLVHQV